MSHPDADERDVQALVAALRRALKEPPAADDDLTRLAEAALGDEAAEGSPQESAKN